MSDPSVSHLAMPNPVYGHYTSAIPPRLPSLLGDTDMDSSGFKVHSIDDLSRRNINIDIPGTPPPTTEEYNLLHGIKKKRTMKENITIILILAIVITFAVLISVFSKKIVKALNPETSWMREHPASALIPIALFIVVSFPPLFGHELIAIIVGVTWDLWPAFGITAIGTILGEIANFMVFKYACTARSDKWREKSLDYGLMAYIVRRGGLLIIIIIRFSAVPPHFATVVFSTVGVPFLIFLLGAVISLPKQFVAVYTGYAMKVGEDHRSVVVQNILIAVTIVLTIASAHWLSRRLKAAREPFVYERRKARQAKLLEELNSDRHVVSFPTV